MSDSCTFKQMFYNLEAAVIYVLGSVVKSSLKLVDQSYVYTVESGKGNVLEILNLKPWVLNEQCSLEILMKWAKPSLSREARFLNLSYQIGKQRKVNTKIINIPGLDYSEPGLIEYLKLPRYTSVG